MTLRDEEREREGHCAVWLQESQATHGVKRSLVLDTVGEDMLAVQRHQIANRPWQRGALHTGTARSACALVLGCCCEEYATLLCRTILLRPGSRQARQAGRQATHLYDSVPKPVAEVPFDRPRRERQSARSLELFRRLLAVEEPFVKPT